MYDLFILTSQYEGKDFISMNYAYNRCSKISNTNCLPKRPRQTAQTQIRLLLIRVFAVCYSDIHFVNSALGPEVIKHFSCSTHEIDPAHKC